MDAREENRKQNEEFFKYFAKKLIKNKLGTLYTGKSFDDYEDKNNIVPAIKSALDDKKSIYLFGDSRKGKTHLTCGIIKYLADKKNPSDQILHDGMDLEGIYINKCVDIDILISDYRDERRMEKIDRIKANKVLVLDDIGVGKLTPERHSMWYYIIDYRICNGLQTIFTSNYRTTQLWGGSIDVEPTRLITRIQEMCVGIEVK